MRIRIPTGRGSGRQRGFALMLVLAVVGVSLLWVAGLLEWSGSSGRLSARFNELNASRAAAEASTEKVLAHISRDFAAQGVSGVDAGLTGYTTAVPNAGEAAEWGDYQFEEPGGGTGQAGVAALNSYLFRELDWKYRGISGYAKNYRVVSVARRVASGVSVAASVRQEAQVASIPLFGYAAFYGVDMEVSPGATDMTLSGPVHCNRTLYSSPTGSRTVWFKDHVTASREIRRDRKPGDGYGVGTGSVVYEKAHDWWANTLLLPVGTNATPTLMHRLIEIPPMGEATNSLWGLQRFYNKADLVILVGATGVTATSGSYNGFATAVPWSSISNFVSTNLSFFNRREFKTVKGVEFKVAAFNTALASLTALLGRQPMVVYIADQRVQAWNTQSGVRVSQGEVLPNGGLTIAAMNPLYVQGHYNAPAAHLGTTNTSLTQPAALIGDAITFLSPNWADANSGSDISFRIAVDTTFNAALLGGIVESAGGSYSGGFENFFRLLEDWSGRTLTFNGSVVALFASQLATAPWGTSSVYRVPAARQYGFDGNFRVGSKLPPGTPEARTMIRAGWTTLLPGNTE